MKVGEGKSLTATIAPDNTTNKNITWKSSDETIATVSTTGVITAIKAGTVGITASTANGKSDTIKIIINEEKKIETNSIVKTTETNKVAGNDTVINNSSEDSNPVGTIATLG